MKYIVLIVAIVLLIPLVAITVALLGASAYFLLGPLLRPLYFLALYLFDRSKKAKLKIFKWELAMMFFSALHILVILYALTLGAYVMGIVDVTQVSFSNINLFGLDGLTWGDWEEVFYVVFFLLVFYSAGYYYIATVSQGDKVLNAEENPSVLFNFKRIATMYLSMGLEAEIDHRKRLTTFGMLKVQHVMRYMLAFILGIILDVLVGGFYATPGMVIIVLLYVYLMEVLDIGETSLAKDVLDQ